MKQNDQNDQNDPQNMQNMRLYRQGRQDQQDQQGRISKKIRLQTQREEYIRKMVSPFPIKRRYTPNFSIIPNTCLGGALHKKRLELLKELRPTHYKFK